jgi:hypothetical protein
MIPAICGFAVFRVRELFGVRVPQAILRYVESALEVQLPAAAVLSCVKPTQLGVKASALVAPTFRTGLRRTGAKAVGNRPRADSLGDLRITKQFTPACRAS